MDSNYKTDDRLALSNGFTISASDSLDLPRVTRVLSVGVAGNIKVTMADDTDPVILAFAAGITRIRVSKVWAASLTASDLAGLY